MEKGVIVAFSIVSMLFALNFLLLALVAPVSSYETYTIQKMSSSRLTSLYNSISADIRRILFNQFTHESGSISFIDNLSPLKITQIQDYNTFLYSRYGIYLTCSACDTINIGNSYTVNYLLKRISVVPNSSLDFNTMLYGYQALQPPSPGAYGFRLSFGGTVVLDGNYALNGEIVDVNTSDGIYRVVLSNPILIIYPNQTILSAEIKLENESIYIRPFKLHVFSGDFSKEVYPYG